MTIVTNTGPHGSVSSWPSESESLIVLDPRLQETLGRRIREAVGGRFYREQTIWVATSGTSGAPEVLLRMVALSRRATDVSCMMVNQHLAAASTDVWLSALPDFHVGGLMIHRRAELCGARYERTVGNCAPWDPMHYARTVKETRATLSALVPTQLFDLVRGGFRAPSCLRALVIGGQALSPRLYRAARALGWPVLPSFGMTEVASQLATAPLDSLDLAGGNGGPEKGPLLLLLPHVEARIDCDRRLSIRSEALCDGKLLFFHDDCGRSAREQFEEIEKGGWYSTSDRATLTDGVLTPLGRLGGAVKIGGELVEIQMLDRALYDAMVEIGFCGDAMVGVVQDERLGACIEIHATSGDTIDALIQRFNRMVPAAARCRAWKIVPIIERTALGKLKRPVASVPQGAVPQGTEE